MSAEEVEGVGLERLRSGELPGRQLGHEHRAVDADDRPEDRLVARVDAVEDRHAARAARAAGMGVVIGLRGSRGELALGRGTTGIGLGRPAAMVAHHVSFPSVGGDATTSSG